MCRYEFRPPLAGIFAHPDLVWPEYWTRKRISGGGGRHAISELRIPLFSSQLNSQLSVIIAFVEFRQLWNVLIPAHWPPDDNSYQVYILRSLVWSMQRWWTCGPASWRSRHRRCCTTTSTTTTAAAPWPEYLDKLAIKICFHCTFAHLCPIAPWDILMMVTGFSPNQLKASSPPNLGSPP